MHDPVDDVVKFDIGVPPDRQRGDLVLAERRYDEGHPLGPLRRVAVALLDVHQAIDPARAPRAGDGDLVALERRPPEGAAGVAGPPSPPPGPWRGGREARGE